VKATAAVVTSLVLAAGAPAPAAARQPHHDRATARVWLTTVDRSSLLAEQAPVSFGTGTSTNPTIVVDPEV